jgi:hypothetical protein
MRIAGHGKSLGNSPDLGRAPSCFCSPNETSRIPRVMSRFAVKRLRHFQRAVLRAGYPRIQTPGVCPRILGGGGAGRGCPGGGPAYGEPSSAVDCQCRLGAETLGHLASCRSALPLLTGSLGTLTDRIGLVRVARGARWQAHTSFPASPAIPGSGSRQPTTKPSPHRMAIRPGLGPPAILGLLRGTLIHGCGPHGADVEWRGDDGGDHHC